MNLVIDAGNTLIKTAVFMGNEILSESKFNHEFFLREVEKIFNSYPDIDSSIISSVSCLSRKDIKALSIFCKVHELSSESKIPFINLYETPKTLGVDRIALITAAYYECKNKNVLIIDSGSCITYDFLSEDAKYYGGAISPGIYMRFRALNTFTANLPLIETTELTDFIGNSTQNSIVSGIINGIIHEIEGTIRQYSERFTDLTIILTGGDSDFLSKRLKSIIFVNSNFLFKGLNHILELNKN